jgi:hypothetical protein
MTRKFKLSTLKFVSFWVIALFAMQFSAALFGDCDMIGILIRNGQTITDVDQLGIQYPGEFNEPSDFWTDWFKNTQVPRNLNGYAIIYYGLNGANTRKVYEWPNLYQHIPFYWNFYSDNQVFRSDDQFTSFDTAFWWAEYRVWNLDMCDHNAHLILAHTRYASGGNNDINNPHPFIWDYPWNGANNPQGENIDEYTAYSMEHNGTITDKQKLRAMTEELWTSWNPEQTWSVVYPYKTENQGNNELVDSEAYFHWIVCNIKLAGNVEEGMRRALIAMKEWDCFKNIVFADAFNMYAYRGFGDLNPGNYHYLVYRVNETPSFYAVSSGKYYDENLFENTVSIQNHQMVKFYIASSVTTYDNFDAPQYHGLPYYCYFDDSLYSTVDSSWYLNSYDDDNQYGRIRVVGNETNRYLLMDSNSAGQYAQNEANMHVNLLNRDRIILKFSWAPFNEETHVQDGVYFSDNGGETYAQVYQMGAGPYGQWQNVEMYVDSLCELHGLEHSPAFVVKFVQYDNYPAYTDGIGVDNISIYTAYADPDGYFMGFDTGSFDEYWEPCNEDNGCRVLITEEYEPYKGTHHMTMDSGIEHHYVASYALLYVDFTRGDCSGYRLQFYIKKFDGEIDPQDALYFSDDGGLTFIRVYGFTPTSSWQEVDLNIGGLAIENGLTLTDKFVIKFQQYGDEGIPNEGLAFDSIRIYAAGPCH